ncbi:MULTISPECIES: DUF2585 domain-containing protein [Brucella]|jgi:hypothetical protein|uniref:UPF0314 protein CEV34_1437 n=1 Tax=Brucella pseudogrignonensis TaxID=419475 RepID=A0A256GLM7_9HYPH|nr:MULTISPECIES: DUF2585 domain-containing protein [Brucella]EMG55652.1 hypothetical protein WYI_00939 [Ochrobactrum sp. CDB2]MBK0019860.1 DUF2585 domain-containing protein [Ochrobactrum sp. S45]MBK0043400.1 DUF2585 domain-containing protein [Ochrobactrum sp. S46]MBO1024645.1 DUF2585 domain-containing protein [Ochrobactrum sp. SD129]MQP39997.1 DUF2585 family protein [Ochrobactrum sp. MYb237]
MSSIAQASTSKTHRWGLGALIVLAILVIQASWLYIDGRIPMCECGTIKLWSGSLMSENSQHIADWYTLSHIIHGFLFYWLLTIIAPKAPLGLRLAVAVGVEAAWELVENSNFIIERYRANTSSVDYFGDSIVNSVSDSVFAMIGFLIAAKLPTKITVATALFFEVLALIVIRDNLTLNVIMLLHPFEFIKQWQTGL